MFIDLNFFNEALCVLTITTAYYWLTMYIYYLYNISYSMSIYHQ